MNSKQTTQVSFARAEYEKKKKCTRREVFLEKTEFDALYQPNPIRRTIVS